LRMTGDVGERFLSDAIEHGSHVTVQLFNPGKSKGREAYADGPQLLYAYYYYNNSQMTCVDDRGAVWWCARQPTAGDESMA